LVLKATVPYKAGATLYPSFEATTTTAFNQQAIRNVSIDVINICDCPDYIAPLTREAARTLLQSTCGTAAECPERTSYLSCVEGNLDSLLSDERIDAVSYEVLLLETQQMLAYCDGYQRCMNEINPAALEKSAYDKGYSDGNLSGLNAGLEQGRASGYAEGYSAGSNDGYITGHSDGYSEGLVVGEASGYQKGYDHGLSVGEGIGYEKGHEIGLNEGFDNGYSVGKNDGYIDGHEKGYQEGFTEGDASGYQRGMQEGFELGHQSGYASGYEQGFNDGRPMTLEETVAYVQLQCPCSKRPSEMIRCGTQTLWKLYRSERISDRTRREAVRQLARRRC
jgi:flagellar biosynthesis/type III secretory pathway protein FliH